MKVVILAGGFGTRLAEETEVRPKPMVEVGGRPLLWHIMKHYAHYGFRDFYVALGYKGEAIKRYFLEAYALNGSLRVDLRTGQVATLSKESDDWTVHLLDTGLHTNTGGRLKRLEPLLRGETFMLTYGDGVSSVDLRALLEFHRAERRIATITAVRPPARFGALNLEGSLVANFSEKPQAGEGWINGGYMVLEPGIFDVLAGDDSSLEAHGLESLAAQRQLAAYQHAGYWQCMDTLRDKRQLEAQWASGRAAWKVWP